MEKFEKQFDDLDVRAGYMESAIDSYVQRAVASSLRVASVAPWR
jgi:hypothetical protein